MRGYHCTEPGWAGFHVELPCEVPPRADVCTCHGPAAVCPGCRAWDPPRLKAPPAIRQRETPEYMRARMAEQEAKAIAFRDAGDRLRAKYARAEMARIKMRLAHVAAQERTTTP